MSSASVQIQVEPVGRWFEAYIKRRNRTASASFQELEEEQQSSEESEDEEFVLQEYPMLRTLDPKDWKVKIQRYLCVCVFVCVYIVCVCEHCV